VFFEGKMRFQLAFVLLALSAVGARSVSQRFKFNATLQMSLSVFMRKKLRLDC
jgi:hypothetical protein